ncbi:MAG: penicillin-binding transpeptidase domain-containing protein [Enhygromyxa sp.]
MRANARIALLSIATLAGPSGCFGCADTPTQAAERPSEGRQALTVEHRPALAERIAAAGYVGVFVLLDPASESLIISDPALAERGFIPASTFKIINSLIALETGVATSPEFALAWDGEERGFDWDRDHDLRSAFRVSAVWYYQELARRIGEPRMAQWVAAADYGNRDISGGVDMFWLNGGLRISPREQVEFLRRVHEGHSPFSAPTVQVFLDEVMIDERREGVTIRAKTGWARTQDFADPAAVGFEGHAGWYVGSVEQSDGSRVYFATLLLAPEPAPETFREDRRELTGVLLRALGQLE